MLYWVTKLLLQIPSNNLYYSRLIKFTFKLLLLLIQESQSECNMPPVWYKEYIKVFKISLWSLYNL